MCLNSICIKNLKIITKIKINKSLIHLIIKVKKPEKDNPHYRKRKNKSESNLLNKE